MLGQTNRDQEVSCLTQSCKFRLGTSAPGPAFKQPFHLTWSQVLKPLCPPEAVRVLHARMPPRVWLLLRRWPTEGARPFPTRIPPCEPQPSVGARPASLLGTSLLRGENTTSADRMNQSATKHPRRSLLAWLHRRPARRGSYAELTRTDERAHK